MTKKERKEMQERKAMELADYMYEMIMDDGDCYSQDEAYIAVESLSDLYHVTGNDVIIRMAHEYFDDMIGR